MLVLLAIGLLSGSVFLAALSIASVVLTSVIAVAYWQIYMRFAAPERTASDIGVMTSLRTLFLMAGGVGAGQVVVELGCAGVFWLAAIMAFVAASLVVAQGCEAYGAVTP